MKLKKSILKDISYRNSFKKQELEIKGLKILIRMKSFNYLHILNIYSKINKRSFISKINNLCFITFRNKSIYKKFNISRIKLKELANNGLLLGLKKYSW
jgi:ribosomal protein S14